MRVNDDVAHYFKTKKGLRQGDLLSPILFNLVENILAILFVREKEDGQVDGSIPHLVDGECQFFSMRMIQLFLWSMI
jgi:hypothetical protein